MAVASRHNTTVNITTSATFQPNSLRILAACSLALASSPQMSWSPGPCFGFTMR